MAHSLGKDAPHVRLGLSGRRQRGRGNSVRTRGSGAARTYESAGPDVKIRGDAAYIVDRYTTLEREARSNGNRVLAEDYAQHAEHYRRVDGGGSRFQGQSDPVQAEDVVRSEGEPVVESAGENGEVSRVADAGRPQMDQQKRGTVSQRRYTKGVGRPTLLTADRAGSDVEDDLNKDVRQSEWISKSGDTPDGDTGNGDTSSSSVLPAREGRSQGKRWSREAKETGEFKVYTVKEAKSSSSTRDAGLVNTSTVGELPAFITTGCKREPLSERAGRISTMSGFSGHSDMMTEMRPTEVHEDSIGLSYTEAGEGVELEASSERVSAVEGKRSEKRSVPKRTTSTSRRPRSVSRTRAVPVVSVAPQEVERETENSDDEVYE